VEDVAYDRHFQAFDAALRLPKREGVEKGLRGVFMGAVSGVDDLRASVTCEKVGGTRRRVPHDDHVRRHRFEVLHGVEQRFALGDARACGLNRQRVGREDALRHLERRARPRGCLHEQIHNRAAPQRRDLLDRAVHDLAHLDRRIQDERDVFTGQRFDAEEVLVPEHGQAGEPFF
jgi:hypothetical protein